MYYNKVRKYAAIIMILGLSSIFAQGQQQMDPETQQLFMQYNQLNQQLQQLQQQAMQDEAIAQKGDALDKKITKAMVASNPAIQKTIDERDQVISEYQTAQQTGDQEALMQLNQKYQTLSQQIQVEQQKVMQDPELQNEMLSFQQIVMKKMEEINPNTPQLMKQIQSLQSQLMQSQGQ